jgi:hypothetical protein
VQTSNNQIDSLQKDIGDLKTKLALQEQKVETINKQLESSSLWLRGIGVAIIAGTLMWIGQNTVDSRSFRKANTVGESISKGK